MVHRRLAYWLGHGAAWLAGRRRLVRVQGGSMRPALEPGRLAWWTPVRFAPRAPAPGEVVLARHPYRRDLRLVKRLARIEEGGRLFLTGDAPGGSTDSFHFGSLPPDALLGVVHLPPA